MCMFTQADSCKVQAIPAVASRPLPEAAEENPEAGPSNAVITLDASPRATPPKADQSMPSSSLPWGCPRQGAADPITDLLPGVPSNCNAVPAEDITVHQLTLSAKDIERSGAKPQQHAHAISGEVKIGVHTLSEQGLNVMGQDLAAGQEAPVPASGENPASTALQGTALSPAGHHHHREDPAGSESHQRSPSTPAHAQAPLPGISKALPASEQAASRHPKLQGFQKHSPAIISNSHPGSRTSKQSRLDQYFRRGS